MGIEGSAGVLNTLQAKFNGIIWKIEIDTVNPYLAIETKVVADRKSFISLVNYKINSVLYQELELPNEHNWHLDKVHAGIVYMHSYLTSDSPQHQGVLAINTNGETLWQMFNKTIYNLGKLGLQVYNPKIQPKIIDVVDYNSGEKLAVAYQNDEIVQNDIFIPSYVSTFPNGLNQHIENLVGEIMWLKLNGIDIYSFHIKTENGYTQILQCLKNEQLLINLNLETDIIKMNPESFFISRNHLFCIRSERREIVSYLV